MLRKNSSIFVVCIQVNDTVDTIEMTDINLNSQGTNFVVFIIKVCRCKVSLFCILYA